jgi:hypothetical protein
MYFGALVGEYYFCLMKFVKNNLSHCALAIGYKEKYIEETVHKTFLGLHVDNHLKWKDHIDQMVPKLSETCYAVRSMFHISINPSSQFISHIFT